MIRRRGPAITNTGQYFEKGERKGEHYSHRIRHEAKGGKKGKGVSRQKENHLLRN